MAQKRQRDYAAEYRRRNELAQERGFSGYGQQRRYLEYTGEAAEGLVAPENFYIPSTRYYFGDYYQGDDERLDIFMRMAAMKDMEPEEAYDRYMRAGRGRQLSRGALKNLEMETFDIDEDETWY